MGQALSLRRTLDPPFVLLLLFVFSVPFEKSVQVAGFGTASKLLGLAAFLAGAAVVTWRRAVRPPNAVLVLGAGFALWSGLTWLWSVAPQETVTRILTLAQLVAMAWLVWQLCRTARQQQLLLGAYVAGAAVASVATILRYVERQQTYYRRYAAAGFDPNDLGLTVALAIPLAFYLARGRARWACWGAIALAEAAVLLSGSRMALIATLIGFAFAARERTQRAAGAVLLALLLLGLAWLAPAASRARLATLPSEIATGTLHGRTRIWKAGLRVLKQHPVSGVGAGAYPEAVEPQLGVPPIPGHEYVAHNTFLSVLVETGPVGFALFGLMLLSAAAFAWMMPDRERVLWQVMLAVWAAGVATLTWEHRKPTWLLLALITTEWARAFREET